jgi:exopolysaccharide production protein ExoZ
MLWLQALRGVAALMVVFFHMRPHWALAPQLAGALPAMHFGFAGVDVFFVLSGFVVYSSARSIVSPRDLLQFVKRRALRIYLGYWPVLLLVAAGSIWVLKTPLPDGNKMLGSVFLLYPSLFDNWLPTAWSLTYELYFYGWIAAIVFLPNRIRLRALVFTFAALTLWNTGWLVFATERVYHGTNSLRFLLSGFGLEFLAGALIAEVFQNFKTRWPSVILMLPISLSLACLGFSIGTTTPLFDRVEAMRAASFGIFAVGILLATLTLQQSHLRAPAWLTRIGDASFGLYLLHPFFLDLAVTLRMTQYNHNPTAVLLGALAMPFVFVALSLLWFRWVERPVMQLISRPKASPALATSADAQGPATAARAHLP